MTDPTCPRCDKPIHDGAYLCEAEIPPLAALLARVTRIAGEEWTTVAKLDVIPRTGQGRPDDLGWERNGDALEPIALPINLEARERWDAAALDLHTWAETIGLDPAYFGIHAEFGQPGPVRNLRTMHPVESAARWIGLHLDYLRRQPQAVEAWRAIENACRQLERVVDRRADTWYAGVCAAATMNGACPLDLYPHHGAKTIQCECGAIHNLAQRMAELLEQVDDCWGPAPVIAGWLSLAGEATTTATIRGYARRGRILAHPDSPEREPWYRVGSVREERARLDEIGRVRDLARVGRLTDG